MKKSLYKLLIASLVAQLTWTVAIEANDVVTDEELFGGDIDTEESTVLDPLEPVNRVIFSVNDFVYLNVLDPFANAYSAVTPDPVEEGAVNFFRNLKYPIRLVGNLLQGKWDGAWVETGRFAINTTVGVAGIFTPADSVEGFAPIPAEDIGQALGAWGVGDGPYLVLPLLGPSNLRDLGGLIGDRAVHPLTEPWSVWTEWEWRFAYGATDFTANSPAIMDRYVKLKGTAIDPYSSMRNAYSQNRRAAIQE